MYPSPDLEEKSETVEEVFEEIKLELAEVITKNSVSSRSFVKLLDFKTCKKDLVLVQSPTIFFHEKKSVFFSNREKCVFWPFFVKQTT